MQLWQAGWWRPAKRSRRLNAWALHALRRGWQYACLRRTLWLGRRVKARLRQHEEGERAVLPTLAALRVSSAGGRSVLGLLGVGMVLAGSGTRAAAPRERQRPPTPPAGVVLYDTQRRGEDERGRLRPFLSMGTQTSPYRAAPPAEQGGWFTYQREPHPRKAALAGLPFSERQLVRHLPDKLRWTPLEASQVQWLNRARPAKKAGKVKEHKR